MANFCIFKAFVGSFLVETCTEANLRQLRSPIFFCFLTGVLGPLAFGVNSHEICRLSQKTLEAVLRNERQWGCAITLTFLQ